jgi:hypothetical protein
MARKPNSSTGVHSGRTPGVRPYAGAATSDRPTLESSESRAIAPKSATANLENG